MQRNKKRNERNKPTNEMNNIVIEGENVLPRDADRARKIVRKQKKRDMKLMRASHQKNCMIKRKTEKTTTFFYLFNDTTIYCIP